MTPTLLTLAFLLVAVGAVALAPVNAGLGFFAVAAWVLATLRIIQAERHHRDLTKRDPPMGA